MDAGIGVRALTADAGIGVRALTVDAGIGARALTADVGIGVRALTADAGIGVRALTADAGIGARALIEHSSASSCFPNFPKQRFLVPHVVMTTLHVHGAAGSHGYGVINTSLHSLQLNCK